MENTTLDTITHIAKPADHRCKWWQAQFNLDELQTKHLEEKAPLKMFKKDADLELEVGAMLIDSEEKHHSKMRGFLVSFGLVTSEGVKWLSPTMSIKMLIKSEGHKDLMKGSGDVAACVRIALYLKRQENLMEAFKKICEIE